MRILADTNILLDILLQRELFFRDSQRIYKLAENNLLKGFISPITINNIIYLARKSHHLDQIRAFIVAAADTLTICRMDAALVKRATLLDFTDLEDSLQAAMAEYHSCDFIITSNLRDYVHSPVPAITAADFIAKHMTL